jgi:hypothetical protein
MGGAKDTLAKERTEPSASRVSQLKIPIDVRDFQQHPNRRNSVRVAVSNPQENIRAGVAFILSLDHSVPRSRRYHYSGSFTITVGANQQYQKGARAQNLPPCCTAQSHCDENSA